MVRREAPGWSSLGKTLFTTLTVSTAHQPAPRMTEGRTDRDRQLPKDAGDGNVLSELPEELTNEPGLEHLPPFGVGQRVVTGMTTREMREIPNHVASVGRRYSAHALRARPSVLYTPIPECTLRRVLTACPAGEMGTVRTSAP